MDRIQLLKEIVDKLETLNERSLATILKATDSCIVVQQLNQLEGINIQTFEELVAS